MYIFPNKGIQEHCDYSRREPPGVLRMGESEVPPVCPHNQERVAPAQDSYQVRTFYYKFQ